MKDRLKNVGADYTIPTAKPLDAPWPFKWSNDKDNNPAPTVPEPKQKRGKYPDDMPEALL